MFTSICVQATTVDFHPTTAGNSRCAHHVCTHNSSMPGQAVCTNSLLFNASCKPCPLSLTSHHTYSSTTYHYTLPVLLSHYISHHMGTKGKEHWDAIRGKTVMPSRQAGGGAQWLTQVHHVTALQSEEGWKHPSVYVSQVMKQAVSQANPQRK